ncbi:mucin-4 isoform X2 [Copidosoma floridanum]|uniref:mucin-4 isoform X2 n=1 Tax=Copidosoma floridanum TaxID=29053 RepID=UPI0006C96E73|nr:mucin-4 isoform X2 [Copidosoma floridanum]
MEQNDGDYQQVIEQKFGEFLIQNQTTYPQDSFDVDSSNFETNLGCNDDQPVNDNTLSNSKSAVNSLSGTKDQSDLQSEKIIECEAQIATATPTNQMESGKIVEMSISNVNEQTSVVASDTVKETIEKPNNHVAKETDKCVDSNTVSVESKIVHSSPTSQSSKNVNCSEKVKKAEEVSLDNSNVLQSDDVAVLAEFSTLNYDLQEEEKPAKAVTKTSEQIIENLNEMMTDNLKDKNVTEEKSVKVLTENSESKEQSKSQVKSNDVSMYEDDQLDLHLSADQSVESHRNTKVLQDIFDDWQDENGDEESAVQSSSAPQPKDPQDSVEMELQNLLNEEVQQDAAPGSNTTENLLGSLENPKSSEHRAESSPVKSKIVVVEKLPSTSPVKSLKSPLVTNSPKNIGQSPKNISSNQSEPKKFQSPRPGVKVPGSHLTSQIATTAEVNEVLKERLKEKQKDLQNPKTADIVFVKKMSQRLSSQLSAAIVSSTSTSSTPIPSQQQKENSDSEKAQSSVVELPSASVEHNKSTTDNELLAILEGDVDPDWSNLKPHGVLEENNKFSESHSSSEGKSGSKLDPATERELALKQLLELPTASSKKKQIRKSVKSSKDGAKDEDEVIHIPSEDDSPRQESKTPKQQKENIHNTRSSDSVELGIEESRSGRKRKLTEKAREHELSVKRQKVIKSKVTPDVKKASEPADVDEEKSETSSLQVKVETQKPTEESSPAVTPKSDSKQKKVDVKQSPLAAKTPTNIKDKETPPKRSSVGVSKKDTPIVKRKLTVKNILKPKKTATKTKSSSPSVTSASKVTTEKSANTNTTPKEKKKTVSEIDRLLQDEGVVNMLYDAEQPDSRKRLVPITKSQKKVMDVEKAERELKFRAKLVKNAVLRLRNSGAPTSKVSPRSRRTVAAAAALAHVEQTSAQQLDKKSTDSSKASDQLDFILPAKIRNAADASRIIRRHSSSSFSSTSVSPRVSIDQPPESLNLEELEATVKSKRKMSHDSTDKADVKKNKKKSISKLETESKESDKSSVKKEPVKKGTKSNASTPPSVKVANKNKKVPKGKSSVESSPADTKLPSKGEEELSACLAEAATALSSSSNATRLSGASANKKKGSTNATKSLDDEKVVGTKNSFSNKEISVRYHGHLVQLILTPSMPASGIRNALTIAAMREFCDALTILRKDDVCRVVLFTSTGTSFCEGLELSSLLRENVEERKSRAKEMAVALKEFLRCLASFNKPIVAGVQGAAIGLGVTMLPLFDLVIASDKATFSTPYGKLGQIAEGTAILALSRSLGTSVTNELLLGGRVLTASEALRAGLVTRVLWPDRFQGELLPSLKTMSEQSARSMEATKAMLRRSLRESLDPYLESESYLLVQHWISSECQGAMKAFIEEKGQ